MKGGSEGDEREEEIERIKIENEQMKVKEINEIPKVFVIQIFSESIRQSGSELERRAEEMNRKLIGNIYSILLFYITYLLGENLSRLRLSRRLIRVEKRLELEETTNRLIREKTLELKSERAMEIALLQRQLVSLLPYSPLTVIYNLLRMNHGQKRPDYKK